MDINFKLNDRKNSNLLSDQIIKSGEKIFTAFLSDDWVQKSLMKGEMTDINIRAAFKREKDVNDFDVLMVFKHLKQMTDDSKEKQFFDICIKEFEPKLNEHNKQFEQIFGKPDSKADNSSMSHWMYCYLLFISNISLKEQFLSELMPILAAYEAPQALMRYLKANPNYIPNNLAKMVLYEEFDCNSVTKRVREMIDCREDQVSEDEVKELLELFQRSIAFECLLLSSNFSGNQWFRG